MCGSRDTASLGSRLHNSEVAREVVKRGYTIVMGAGETGSMRDVKEIAKENGNMLLVVGREEELDRSSCADIKISVLSTFERALELYNDSDTILFLDGGAGTLSEFISFLNNKIELNDLNKELILYNKDGVYNRIIKDLERRYREGLTSDVHTYFREVSSINELRSCLDEIEHKFTIEFERRKVK